MSWDPDARKRLGRAIRASRERQGMSLKGLARKAGVSDKTVSNIELTRTGFTRTPLALERVAQALGWLPGSIDSVLAGGEPHFESDESEPAPDVAPTGAGVDAVALYPAVVAFGRQCVQQGGDPQLRDRFEVAAEELLKSVSSAAAASTYGLAAYRPHAPGEAVPEDDQERILRAMEADDNEI